MANTLNLFTFCILFSLSSIAGWAQIVDDDALQHAWDFADAQLRETLNSLRQDASRHPKVTNNVETDGDGQWKTTGRGGWTSGFFSGCLWKMAMHTHDEFWQQNAAKWTADLESQKYNDGDHDIGFRMLCSFGQGYHLKPNDDYKQILHTAATTLASRFDETIGCIKSWDWTGNYAVIIDNMMNLELLFWSAKNGGNAALYDMAVSHADKTRENHVYEDGSTWHVVDYADDGSVIKKFTQQGYSDGSCWSRGQAWGIYGFTVAYRETGASRFLETAEHLANYFIQHLPDDYVPYSDFNAPNIPNCEKDASAAAITCAALFELDQFSTTDYRTSAENILQSLLTQYLAESTVYASILHRASQWWGDDERGSIYADYYVLEAMQRYEQAKARVATTEKPPETVQLQAAYPNPFNPTTCIAFELPAAGIVHLDVLSATGTQVATLLDQHMSAGPHEVYWHGMDAAGKSVASGLYLYRLHYGNQCRIKKVVLMR